MRYHSQWLYSKETHFAWESIWVNIKIEMTQTWTARTSGMNIRQGIGFSFHREREVTPVKHIFLLAEPRNFLAV